MQPVHERLPPGHRRDGVRPEGRADGRSGVRPVLGVRGDVPDRCARIWTGTAQHRRGDPPRRTGGLAHPHPGARKRHRGVVSPRPVVGRPSPMPPLRPKLGTNLARFCISPRAFSLDESLAWESRSRTPIQNESEVPK